MSVFDPAVVTIAKIAAGTTDNVIPETAEMAGTMRTLSEREPGPDQAEPAPAGPGHRRRARRRPRS